MAIVCAVLVSMLLADIDESTVLIFTTYFAIFATVFFVVECVVCVSLYVLINDYVADVEYREAALLGIVAGSPSVFLAGTLGVEVLKCRTTTGFVLGDDLFAFDSLVV